MAHFPDPGLLDLNYIFTFDDDMMFASIMVAVALFIILAQTSLYVFLFFVTFVL
jgi:hypothetical protein